MNKTWKSWCVKCVSPLSTWLFYCTLFCNAFINNFQNGMNFCKMNTVLGILITMRQIGYQILQKTDQQYYSMHSCIQLMVWNLWGHRHSALLFGDTLHQVHEPQSSSDLFQDLWSDKQKKSAKHLRKWVYSFLQRVLKLSTDWAEKSQLAINFMLWKW